MAPRMPRVSLLWKFLLAFLLVVVSGVMTFWLLAGEATAREVRGFMFRGGMTDAQRLAGQLAAYYQGRGGWVGVDSLIGGSTFDHPGMGHPNMGGPHGMGGMAGVDMAGVAVTLADPQGSVIASTSRAPGEPLPPAELEEALPIMVEGETVGYLVVATGDGRRPEEDLLGRLRRLLGLSSLVAGGVALLVGGGLVIGLLRPIRDLTRAARALAAGDLHQRVSVRTTDEVGELSQAFNQMAENLERAEALRKEMTADVAHELRNPLAVMQARLEGIVDGVYEPTAENLNPVLEQARLLNRLIEDLRTLAMADSGALSLEREPVDLGDLAARMVEGHRAQAGAAGVEIALQLQEGTGPVVDADPSRIGQVLGNLLSNALRHTPEGGRVEVEVRAEAERGVAILEVRDTGEGIPPEALPYIFERFFRADRGRSRQAGGSGLGLAIARKLVEAHGGTLTASNRPEGGAVFRMALPLAGPGETSM